MINNIEAVEPTPHMRRRAVMENGITHLAMGFGAWKFALAAAALEFEKAGKYHTGGTVDPRSIPAIWHNNEMIISADRLNDYLGLKAKKNFTFHLTEWFRHGIKSIKQLFNL